MPQERHDEIDHRGHHDRRHKERAQRDGGAAEERFGRVSERSQHRIDADPR